MDKNYGPFGFGYEEEREFQTLQSQCKENKIQQETTDANQTEKIAALEQRVAVLEEYVFKAQTNDMVANIENMKEGEALEVAFPTDVVLSNKSLEVKPNTNVTIELNDKEIKAETPNYDAILVGDGATLTINGNGKVTAANGGNGYPIIANGKLIINGGEFVSGYDAENLTNACVYARGNGQIEIYGGRFETVDGTFVLNKKDADRATTSIKVFGGEFVNFDPSDNASEIPHENFVAEGYKVESYTEGDKTIYKVVKA